MRATVTMKLLNLVCVALLLAGSGHAAPVAAPNEGHPEARSADALGAGRLAGSAAAAPTHDTRAVFLHERDTIHHAHHGGMRRAHRRAEPTWEPYSGTILLPHSEEETETVTMTKQGKKVTKTKMRTTTDVVTKTKSVSPSQWTSTAVIAAQFTLHGQDGQSIDVVPDSDRNKGVVSIVTKTSPSEKSTTTSTTSSSHHHKHSTKSDKTTTTSTSKSSHSSKSSPKSNSGSSSHSNSHSGSKSCSDSNSNASSRASD